MTEQISTHARAIIDKDPTITIRFLSLELDVSCESAQIIVRDEIELKNRYARWIPHPLADEQKQERVRMCKFFSICLSQMAQISFRSRIECSPPSPIRKALSV